MPFTEVIPAGDVSIEVLRIDGQRPGAFLLPGAAGGISGYADLCERLTVAGLPTVGLNPRGCGASLGDLQGVTLAALAHDVAAVIAALRGAPAIVIGHAGGNRIARMLATDHPDAVSATVLLAAGGKVPGADGARSAMQRSLDPTLSADERARAAAEAFFAPANAGMASGWIRPDLSQAFSIAFQKALQQIPVDHWWAGGTAPMLVIQGKQDRMAPPANGHLIAAADPGRVRVVDLDDAGHALYVEQPERITQLIVEWVAELRSDL